MSINDKANKERQRRNFFILANEEYGITTKSYDALSSDERTEIVRSLRYVKRMAYMDRGKYDNFKKYMIERPIYFEDIFRKPCTPKNIREEYMELKRKGYGDDYTEPEEFARIGTEGSHWRSRKKT